jgi:glycerol kinase
LGRPIEISQQTELTAYGCALLASESFGTTQFVSNSKANKKVLPNSAGGSAAQQRFAEAVMRSLDWREFEGKQKVKRPQITDLLREYYYRMM